MRLVLYRYINRIMKIILNLMCDNPFAFIFHPILRGKPKTDLNKNDLQSDRNFGLEEMRKEESYLVSSIKL